MILMRDFRVLFSADQIQTRIASLAQEIDATYATDDVLHIISVLRGGFVFTADLIRALSRATTIDFARLESYGAARRSTGSVTWHVTPENVAGRHVLIVEDIVDTGLTLGALRDRLRSQNPASLRTACLLSKPARRSQDVPVEFLGFSIPDRFVIGYGLDLDQRYRELPYLAYLTEESEDPSGARPGDRV